MVGDSSWGYKELDTIEHTHTHTHTHIYPVLVRKGVAKSPNKYIQTLNQYGPQGISAEKGGPQ